MGLPESRSKDGEKEGSVVGETKGSMGMRRQGQLEENPGGGRAFSSEHPSIPSFSKHVAPWIRMNILEKVQGLM